MFAMKIEATKSHESESACRTPGHRWPPVRERLLLRCRGLHALHELSELHEVHEVHE